MDLWEEVIKWTEVAVAIALLYFRFCLYETEEGHLQNALAEAWIRISDISDSARKRFERLLAESGRLSQSFFNSLLGPRLLSLRAISISGCLLWISSRMSNTVLGSGYNAYTRRDLHDLYYQFGELIIILISLLIPLAPLIIRKRWAPYIPIAIFLAMQLGSIAGAAYEFLANIWIAIAVDYLWLLAVRRGTQWALRKGSIWRHMLVIASGVAATVVFFMILPGHHRGLISRDWLDAVPPTVADIILFQSDARFFIASVSLIQLCVMVFGFLNWIIWPILSRVVYAAERHQVFRERKLFATFGIALLLHAAGPPRGSMRAEGNSGSRFV
jgi:hypothetical protein